MRLFFLAVLGSILPQFAQADLGFHVGGHLGYGQMGDKTTSTVDAPSNTVVRSVGSFDIQGMPAFKFNQNYVLLGWMLIYRFHSQFDDDTALADFSGRSFLMGPGIALDLPFAKFLFSWLMRTRHTYSGPETTYKGSGFQFLAGYKVVDTLSVDLQYVVSSYNSRDQNGGELGLNGENVLTHRDLSFGLSWTF